MMKYKRKIYSAGTTQHHGTGFTSLSEHNQFGFGLELHILEDSKEVA